MLNVRLSRGSQVLFYSRPSKDGENLLLIDIDVKSEVGAEVAPLCPPVDSPVKCPVSVS